MKSAHQYQLQSTLWQQAGVSLHLATITGKETNYLVKVFEQEYFTGNKALLIQKEIALLKDVKDIPGTIEFVEQIDHLGKPAIVYIKPAGFLLSDYLQTQWSFSDSQTFCAELLRILGQLHGRKINFNNLNPQSLFWHAETQTLTFIDFFKANSSGQNILHNSESNLDKERLPYLSPEATGRMNRVVDYRSDFYSLGVLLYQIIIGQLPFKGEKQLELIHAHLAVQPTSLRVLRPELPVCYEQVVFKLLAKNADDRYRSVYGLKHDIEICVEIGRDKDSAKIELGQADISSQLQLPQKLYGRDSQVRELLNAFEQVLQNGSQMLLVSGDSGTGKSALINEIQKPIVAHQGMFVSGKFDQFNRGIPFEPVIKALNKFVKQMLSREAAELAKFRSKALETIGDGLAVLFEFMPELPLVVGQLPEAAPLPPAESQQRFNRIFLDFVRLTGQKDQVLVVFLDDLQWADGATLSLLEQLLNEPGDSYLMLICAVRGNEISQNQGLELLLKKAVDADMTMSQIALEPLVKNDVEALLSDTFSCSKSELTELTNLCWQKSLGNPFYLDQLLLSLYEDKHIHFDVDAGKWQWQIEQISDFAVSDNVAELMAHKMDALPDATLKVMKTAAVFGNEFSYKALMQISALSHQVLINQLLPAIERGYFMASGEDVELLKVSQSHDGYNAKFKFLHDQVRQAAYASIDSLEKQDIHLRYGIWLLEQDKGQDIHLFESVNHLNRSGCNVTGEFVIQLLQLNIRAANRAKSTTAYQIALGYVEKAIEWKVELAVKDEGLEQELELLQAECLFLSGQADQSLSCTKLALTHTQGSMARAALYNQQLIVNSNLGRFEDAIVNVGEAIKALGFEWPETDEEINQQMGAELAKIDNYLKQNSPMSLQQLEPMTDEKVLLLSLLYASAWPAALNVNYPLSTLFVFKLVTLSIEHGNSSVSPFGYVNYGTMLTAQFGRYQEGYDFGKLAVELVESSNNLALMSKVYTMFGVTNSPWTVHLPENIKLLNKALSSGLESGDMIFTSHSAFHILMLTQLSGLPLSRLQQSCEQNIGIINRVADVNVLEVYDILYQSMALWRGDTSNNNIWDHDGFDEAKLVEQMESQQHSLCLNYFHFNKMVQAYHFGRFEEALVMAEAAEQTLVFTFGWLSIAEHCFYHCLILAQLYPNATPENQDLYQTKMQECLAKMEDWQQHCDANFGHKYALMKAEVGRVNGDTSSALSNYELAIRSAEDFDFIMHQGLCYQLAGEFMLSQGHERFAKLQINQAVTAYELWGGKALVDFLSNKFSNLLHLGYETKHSRVTEANQNQDSELDFDGLLSAAQSISGHIVEEQLINDLMSSIMELAGAQTAKLVLNGEKGLYLAAKGDDEANQVEIISEQACQGLSLPENIINYVQRSHQQLVLSDASADSEFITDKYVQEQQPKSILCAPIIQNNQLLGIIYLENNLVAGAFTADRLKALSVLASQAAVSLVNASLYREMEQRIADRTEELSIAKYKAEEAAAAKSDFLAKMSHEIRTPLNAVIGLSQLTLKSDLGVEQKNNLGKILGSSEALLGLINDILDFSKIEVGKMKLDRVSFSLEKVVQQSVGVVSLKAHEKNLELITYISPDVPRHFIGDPLRLQQIITNLCSNAVKFTDQGTVSIVVNHKQNKDRTALQFRVVDSGIGISEEQQAKLFQSFSQVDESITRRFGGTGLGLAICKQLTDMMDGDINVTSELGKGATFTFTVQLEEDIQTSDILKVSRQQLSQLKVLVVDDVKLSQTVVCDPLTNIGIETDTADNGKEALSKIRQASDIGKPYDLIFLDWKMPEMDGIELAEVLQNEMENSVPKIIMVSAFNKEEVKALALPLGISHFLEKPVNQSHLVDYLISVVSGINPMLEPSTNNYKAMNLSNHKILLVEDNKLNQQVAVGFLSDTLAQVDIAENGVEALAMLVENKDYDLILMDIQMPVMDGLTATKKAREELGVKIPIIAMTAHAMEGDSDKSILAGMNEHITKPIDSEHLYFTLNKYLTADLPLPVVENEQMNAIEHEALISPSNTIDALCHISELDVKRALANVRGDHRLLESLVKDFATQNQNFEQRIEQLLAGSDNEALYREMHSMKSNAAYIGALELSGLAATIELAIDDGDVDKVQVKKFSLHVADLAQKLADVIQQHQKQVEQKALDVDQVKVLIAQLTPLVQESNSMAETIGQELLEICMGTELQEPMKLIYQDLNNFDFDEAHTKLMSFTI